MTRSRFLTLAASLLAAPFAARTTEASPPAPAKLGYIAVGRAPLGTSHGDWTVRLDGKQVIMAHNVQAAHDIQGWYDYIHWDANGPSPRRMMNGELLTSRVHGRVSIHYHGNDPRYAAFKDSTQHSTT